MSLRTYLEILYMCARMRMAQAQPLNQFWKYINLQLITIVLPIYIYTLIVIMMFQLP